MRKFVFSFCLAVAGCLAMNVNSASAAVYSLIATDSGWYDGTGFHDSTNDNYIAGTTPIDHNNFFVFDLSSVVGTITSATLNLTNPSATGTDRIYNIYDVSTPIATLSSSNTTPAIFADLESGTNLGSNSGPFPVGIISTSLNASGLSYLQAAIGGSVALGGDYASADGTNWLFGFTGSPGDVRELVINTDEIAAVPEPSSLLIFGGLAGLMATRLRRKKTA